MATQALGVDQARERLTRLGAALADSQAPLESALLALRQVIARSFLGQQGPGGDPWPALRPATERAKTRLGYPPDALVRTGLLRDGWEAQTQPGADSATLRSRAAYGGFLNAGTRSIPARPFVPEAGLALEVIRSAYAQALAEALERA